MTVKIAKKDRSMMLPSVGSPLPLGKGTPQIDSQIPGKRDATTRYQSDGQNSSLDTTMPRLRSERNA